MSTGRNNLGRTPPSYAAERGNTAIFDLLLYTGKARSMSARRTQVAIVGFERDMGMDGVHADLKDEDDLTPLAQAILPASSVSIKALVGTALTSTWRTEIAGHH